MYRLLSIHQSIMISFIFVKSVLFVIRQMALDYIYHIHRQSEMLVPGFIFGC